MWFVPSSFCHCPLEKISTWKTFTLKYTQKHGLLYVSCHVTQLISIENKHGKSNLPSQINHITSNHKYILQCINCSLIPHLSLFRKLAAMMCSSQWWEKILVEDQRYISVWATGDLTGKKKPFFHCNLCNKIVADSYFLGFNRWPLLLEKMI